MDMTREFAVIDKNNKINLEALQMMSKIGTEPHRFLELMMMYRCAILEVKTKLDVLNQEFAVKTHNPIDSIKTRIKEPKSILEKLQRRGYELSVESVVNNIHDIAGIRVICSFIDDIYVVANCLMKQDDIHVLEVKDYIKNPKDNGYRSLHIILEVPVFLSESKKIMKVEVQIRTIAMDFWASLEHEIHYKKTDYATEDIIEDLKDCADGIYRTDVRMQNIRKRLSAIGEKMNEKKGEQDEGKGEEIFAQRKNIENGKCQK